MLDLGRHQLTRWERGESVCPDDVHAQLVTLYERWERHQLAGRDLVNGVKAMPRKRRARRSDAASSTG
jgi:hypothetical protein